MSRAFLVIASVIAVGAGGFAAWPTVASILPTLVPAEARAAAARSVAPASASDPKETTLETDSLEPEQAALVEAMGETFGNTITPADGSVILKDFSYQIVGNSAPGADRLMNRRVQLRPWLIATPTGLTPASLPGVEGPPLLEEGSVFLVSAIELQGIGNTPACADCPALIFAVTPSGRPEVPPAFTYVTSSGQSGEPGAGRTVLYGNGRPGFAIEEKMGGTRSTTTNLRLFEFTGGTIPEYTATPIPIAATSSTSCGQTPGSPCFDLQGRWSIGAGEVTDVVIQFEGTSALGGQVSERATWRLQNGRYVLVDGRDPVPAF
jgi:hypothetical protein